MRLVVDAGREARVVAQGVDFAGPAIPAGFHDSYVLSCRRLPPVSSRAHEVPGSVGSTSFVRTARTV